MTRSFPCARVPAYCFCEDYILSLPKLIWRPIGIDPLHDLNTTLGEKTISLLCKLAQLSYGMRVNARNTQLLGPLLIPFALKSISAEKLH